MHFTLDKILADHPHAQLQKNRPLRCQFVNLNITDRQETELH
jgi:hypothetical protein